ncbi:MAG: hypothetical protein SFV81_20820 [Pirellulaceae bacterium]|nr:hypothetical protein [Pirellulaceae bacterium]
MTKPELNQTRRGFVKDVGSGAIAATIGFGLASDMGLCGKALANASSADPKPLEFGDRESLVCLMQETPVEKLQPKLAELMKQGTSLRDLVAAGALANARTFGGEDYIGFHTMMALSPVLKMAAALTDKQATLPVFKVLYRNTQRIQEFGGRGSEVLHALDHEHGDHHAEVALGERLRTSIRQRELAKAEQELASAENPQAAFDAMLYAVEDNTEVHRVVLPYRAFDLLDVVGQEHATTMLRQSVRYCVKAESYSRNAKWDEPRSVLPRVFDQFKLDGKSVGTKVVDDDWIEQMVNTLFQSEATIAAEAVGAALAEGVDPKQIGIAISLAANQLVLRDQGRRLSEESPGKPVGSVHGDSIGVHASDSANAWRNMARLSTGRNQFACLILGGYQVALDRVNRGGDFAHWQPLPLEQHVSRIESKDASRLIGDLDDAVKSNLQARAAAIAQLYGQQGFDPIPLFNCLLKYAISEDGSLHAEKFYHTAFEEFTETPQRFRWRQLVGLARVTASEYGRPAAGQAEARQLLGLG